MRLILETWRYCHIPQGQLNELIVPGGADYMLCSICLTQWGRVTHIGVGKLTIIGSDNGFSPGRRQAIIWTNPGILLIGHLGTSFSEILIEIHTFSFKTIDFKMSSGKWRRSCLGLNVLTHWGLRIHVCFSELGHQGHQTINKLLPEIILGNKPTSRRCHAWFEPTGDTLAAGDHHLTLE